MTDERYTHLFSKWGDRSLSILKSRQWTRAAKRLGCSIDECREFASRVLEHSAPESKNVSQEKLEHKYSHDSPYWHDPERGVYVVWLPHLPKPIALPADTWASIKAAYSQWNGAPSSVEDIARKFGMTRRSITALLRVMSHTHTGSPWTREQVAASDDQALVEDLILAREERVLRQAETKRWGAVKAKADSWDRLQLGCLNALNDWLSAPGHGRFTVPEIRDVQSGHTVVLGLTDLHYGALGHDATSAVQHVLGRLFQRWGIRGFPERVVFPIGSDGMHYDTAGYTTTHGTRMDASGHARETIVGYMDLMANLISQVASVCHVFCVPLAGNHDRLLSYATFAAMRLAFAQSHRVSFSESLSDIQVLTHGRSFIALHHGDLHKPEALGGILPRDFAPQWGATKYRYCLMGHYHTSGTFGSKSGIECVYMPSLSPTDEWSESMGFRSHPALSAYTFDAEEGLITVDTIRSH